MKIGNITSDFRFVNGGVPQGTLSGPELFIHMVSDLLPDEPNIKYMDDTTAVEIGLKVEGSHMQQCANKVDDWSEENKLGINGPKTKEMLVSFGKDPVNLEPIQLNNTEIERVDEAKLLGVIIQSNLKWDSNTHYINKKASKRLYYL